MWVVRDISGFIRGFRYYPTFDTASRIWVSIDSNFELVLGRLIRASKVNALPKRIKDNIEKLKHTDSPIWIRFI